MGRRKWRYGTIWDEYDENEQEYFNSLQVTFPEAKEIVQEMLRRNADHANPDFEMFTVKQARSLRKILEIASKKLIQENPNENNLTE